MNIKDLPRGDKFPEEFNVVIEIQKGSHNKYEYDEELDTIKLDRVYFSSSMVPSFDYGFIPQTRSEDGDHLDALIVIDQSLFPGCLVTARPIGVINMVDSGEKDEKIVAVAVSDIHHKHIQSVEDLGPNFQKEVQHYFEHYKDLENKKVEITSWGDKNEALEVLKKSQE